MEDIVGFKNIAKAQAKANEKSNWHANRKLAST